ncbi:leucine-rich repeat and immunoglobulin-like domain-containing nogo receptor-interacting protein 3 [Centruroides sculpturatus]|uniref:leucine-rich repeat and immunoglobulin-like domain-containing nogo receptor-interacting protein 3 n=1 Tax=Centruroides sculpturatus TaxID=218467 RepID=UPI000C6DC8F7|nr:leucine-rich repeat and immunoglobulin-like domain-containing nogo receptor-interacting protein 3 [Centruroides sculpturatus]
MKSLLLILISIITPIFGLLHRCPHTKHFPETRLKQQISYFNSCVCEKHQNSSVNIICQGFKNEEEFKTALNFLREFFVDEFRIRSSSFHLPTGIFKGSHIQKIIFEDVRFETLVLFSSFKGLEFELEELQFIRCRINHVIWQKGNQLKFLKILKFEKTNLPTEMSNAIFKNFPSKIRNLKMTNCNIIHLGNQALTKFSLIETIELDENQLTKISRSMFPSQARKLRYLSLASNPITQLPEDLFQNMDRLEFLLLSGIRVSSLSNNTFFPVWNQLEEIYMNNIKINCDCNILWMLEKNDAAIVKKPYCINYNIGLIDIRNGEEICPRRRNKINK